MTYRLAIRIEAEQDITDAAIWYHNQRPGLGEEFIAAVQVALEGAVATDSFVQIRVHSRTAFSNSC